MLKFGRGLTEPDTVEEVAGCGRGRRIAVHWAVLLAAVSDRRWNDGNRRCGGIRRELCPWVGRDRIGCETAKLGFRTRSLFGKLRLRFGFLVVTAAFAALHRKLLDRGAGRDFVEDEAAPAGWRHEQQPSQQHQ
jgi:hypothetical protein